MLIQRVLDARRRLPLLLCLVMVYSIIPGPSSASAIRSIPNAASVVVWRGGTDDPRWSNPANWEGGRVPNAKDQVRLPAGAGDALVDLAFSGRVAAITLDERYAGTLTLAHALDVRGPLVVNGGTVLGGADVLNAETLTIAQGAVVRLGANGKLNLTGDGSPLSGDGLLDTTTHTPNSVEYTGHATGDLTTASPSKAYHALAQAPGGQRMGHSSPPALPNAVLPLAPAIFTTTSTLTLPRAEEYVTSAVIDQTNGFAYFGTSIAPYAPGTVVKIRLSDFTRVGALILNTGEGDLTSAVIDAGGIFAYFGTATSQVVKVSLTDFTRVGALTLVPGELLTSAVIDTAMGVAYFGTTTRACIKYCPPPLPPRVVKVRLSDLTEVASLQARSQNLSSAVMDAAQGYAYFGTTCVYPCTSVQADILKVRLLDFTLVSSLALNDWEDHLASAVIDPVNGFAYFASACSWMYRGCNAFGNVVKVRLSDFSRVGTLANIGGSAAVSDISGGLAYFGTYTSPALVVKVRLSDFSRLTALSLYGGEYAPWPAAIDANVGFAYFGTDESIDSLAPAHILKVRLSDLTRVGSLTLNSGEEQFTSVVLDADGGFAYFGTSPAGCFSFPCPPAPPNMLVKIRLSDFTRVAAIPLNTGPAVIDTANRFAYFGSGGTVARVRLSDFKHDADLVLSTEPNVSIATAVIDTSNGFAYFGTAGCWPCPTPFISKVRLSDFTSVLSLTLANMLTSAVIDPANGFAYFGETFDSPGKVIKLRLSDLTVESELMLDPGEEYLDTGIIDTINGFAYFGAYNFSGSKVVKVRLSNFTRVGALRLSASPNYRTSAVIDMANGFAYFGTGSVPGPGMVMKVRVGFNNLVLTLAGPLVANSGDVITYTLNVRNDSPDTATGLALTDTLPLSVTFVSAPGCAPSGGAVVCSLGSLADGAGTQVLIQVQMTSTATETITNSALVSASEARFSTPVAASARAYSIRCGVTCR